jgi:kanamycin kinase
MKRTEISLDTETLPPSIRPFLKGAKIFDSSCSEYARTLFVDGRERAFLKIGKRGALRREYEMTKFLHGHRVAPHAIAYESGPDGDYLLTEAVSGEDGTSAGHLGNPGKLAGVFGEYLNMLHSLPPEGCPYPNRTRELLQEARGKGMDLGVLEEYGYSAADRVIIHGDYCLPNIIMDNFAFKGFIDVGGGGIGDRHYDLYWGIWTLRYNLKTDKYKDAFLDAYGRHFIDEEGLRYFSKGGPRSGCTRRPRGPASPNPRGCGTPDAEPLP